MKVCIVNQLGRAQGPDHTDAVIADCFIKKGFNVIFATNSKLDIKNHFKFNFDIDLRNEEIKVYGILPSKLANYPVFGPIWVWIALQMAVRREKPDFILCDGVPYSLLNKNKHSKEIVYFSEPISGKITARLHGVSGPFYAKIYSIIYSKILQIISTNKMEIIVANSKKVAKHYENLYNKKVFVLPSPVDTSKFQPKLKENIVTHVGVFNPRKKIELVIEAIVKSKTKPRLVIIGNIVPGLESYVNYLKNKVKELNIENRVSFKINASFIELRDSIEHSKIFVSAGVEYFSLAVIEQMSAGCIPIVSKKYVPWYEIIEKGKYGFGFNSTDELAEIIDKINNDSDLASNMKKLVIERAKEFDIKNFCEKLFEIINK